MTISLRSASRATARRGPKKSGSRLSKRGVGRRQSLLDSAGGMLPDSSRAMMKSATTSLSKASKRLGSAANDLVAWGRSNPVKAAAAATALAAVSALLYAAHGRHSESVKTR